MNTKKSQEKICIQKQICGTKVDFPFEPYSIQFVIIDKVIKSIKEKKNALIEAPTGTGKSLSILCSTLAWQQAEKENQKDLCSSNDNQIMNLSINTELKEEEVKNEESKIEEIQKENSIKENEKKRSCQTLLLFDTENWSDAEDFDLDLNIRLYQKRKKTTKVSKKMKSRKTTEEIIDLSDNSNALQTKRNSPKSNSISRNYVSSTPTYVESTQPYLDPIPSNFNSSKNLHNSKPKQKNISKIFYGTRTHSQVSQVVNELKTTNYRPKMCVLGAREHYCIHPKVSLSQNISAECKNLLEKPRGCSYNHKLFHLTHHPAIDSGGIYEIWDIEDLVNLGHEVEACPYFSSREIQKTAEIIFCPYNYLIDPIIRDSMRINLEESIIILDEAHNIEDVCRTSASFESELDKLIELQSDLAKICRSNLSQLYAPFQVLINTLVSFVISQTKRLNTEDFEKNSNIFKGAEILGLLATANFTFENSLTLFQQFQVAIEESSQTTHSDLRLKPPNEKLLESLLYIIRFFFSDNLNYINDYRLVISGFAKERIWTYSVGIWCLNPSIAFKPIAQVAKSIILTSGTLNPLNCFAEELNTKFEINLEMNHVINPDTQLWIRSIELIDKTRLNGRHKNVDSYNYQDAIGKAILEYCKIIPHGVLCFFPSYSLLQKLIARWKVTGLWNNLIKIKHILIETKSGDFSKILNDYYNLIKLSTLKKGMGVLFLAIFRGKVSEGLDFSDNNCRGVISVGIPYPQIKDLKITLKIEYNNEKKDKILNGDKWYDLQAFRSLNQALGRCIRHKRDYGAIILLDERFNSSENINKLSKWMRSSVKLQLFEESLVSLKNFFSNIQSVFSN